MKTLSTSACYAKRIDMRKVYAERIEEPLLKGVYRPPYFVNIHLSNGYCNSNCGFCVKGNHTLFEEKLISDIGLFTKKIEHLLALRSADGNFRIEEFHFDGDSSDPLMPNNIACLAIGIEMIKNAGRRVEVITNGINLGDPQLRKVIHLVDLVVVSLNATTAAEHKAISNTNMFNTIVRNIEETSMLVENMNKLRQVGDPEITTRINISHVVDSQTTLGQGNLSDLEAHAKKLLSLPIVDNYLFRFDMYEKSPWFIKNMTKKIERVRHSLPWEFQERLIIKPFMSQRVAQLLEHCVAAMLWNTMLPDGSFTGCAHNASYATVLKPLMRNPYTLKKLKMICARSCPSMLGYMNKLLDLTDGPSIFEGFISPPSELMKLLFKTDELEQPVSRGLVTAQGADYKPYLTPTSYQALAKPFFENAGPYLYSKDIATIMKGDLAIGYLSVNYQYMFDSYHNNVGIASNLIRLDHVSAKQKINIQTNNSEIIIQHADETERIPGQGPGLVIKEGERVLGTIIQEPHVVELKPYDDSIRNGNDLLISRAKYFSSHAPELIRIPSNIIDELNQFLASGHIVIREEMIAPYLLSAGMNLRAYLTGAQLPQDAWTMNLELLARNDFRGTLLDYSHYLRRSKHTGQIKHTRFTWFYPSNSFNELNLNFLYWIKRFGRQAYLLHEKNPKLIDNSASSELLMILDACHTQAGLKCDKANPLNIIEYMMNKTINNFSNDSDPNHKPSECYLG